MSNVPVVHGFGAPEAGGFDVLQFSSDRLKYDASISYKRSVGSTNYQKLLELTAGEFLVIVQADIRNPSRTMYAASLFARCKNDGADNITVSDALYSYKPSTSDTDPNLYVTDSYAKVTRKVSTDGTLTIGIDAGRDFCSMCLPYITIVGIK